jgi:hypothetical protein
MDVVSLFMGVPDVIWSGVIASLLTLGGVYLSNRGNNTRLRTQLEHDRNLKATERIFSVRKEVYLEGMESMANAINHLAELQPPTDKPQESHIRRFLLLCAKIQLIAEPATNALVNDLAAMYNAFNLKFSGKKIPLKAAELRRELGKKKKESLYAERERLNSEIWRLEAANNDEVLLNSHREAQMRILQSIEDFTQQLLDDELAVSIEYSKFLKSMLPDIRLIAKAQAEVIIAIRSDIGLKSDRKLLDIQAGKQMAFVEDAISRIDAFMEQLENGEPK